jgi:hypothetical protein
VSALDSLLFQCAYVRVRCSAGGVTEPVWCARAPLPAQRGRKRCGCVQERVATNSLFCLPLWSQMACGVGMHSVHAMPVACAYQPSAANFEAFVHACICAGMHLCPLPCRASPPAVGNMVLGMWCVRSDWRFVLSQVAMLSSRMTCWCLYARTCMQAHCVCQVHAHVQGVLTVLCSHCCAAAPAVVALLPSLLPDIA